MEDAEVKRIQRKIDRALDCNELREAKEQYVNLAAYLTRYEDYEDGLNAYKKALSICEREGWELDGAIAQRMIAETYCALGEYEEAVKHADLYLTYSIESNNNIEEQRGYATKGRIYFCWAEFLINEKSKSRKKINCLLNQSLSAYEQSLQICLKKLNSIDAREKEEMKSRLFQNLGLVMGSLGRYKEANSNFTIAIQINKTQNFKENLYWCYFNQGEYYYRAGECANACTYCDLAVKVASSKEGECDALKLKAKAYLNMGDILKAKNVLREAYKKQQGKDEEVMEQLRITVFLCKLEKKIQDTPNTDYMKKKSLYEKKGDAYCALKQYSQGVAAYLKMLDFAEKISKSRKELLPCYTSLAQTYKDDGQYSSALFYCQKELELIDELSSEGCKTYLFLAELYEFLDYDYDTVHNTYQKALKIAQEIGDKVQEAGVLSTLVQMQFDFGYVTLAEQNQQVLNNLKRELDDFCEEDNDIADATENFSCDVDDDELLSDNEDSKSRHNRRRECFKVKRNAKGETDLHLAAIKGDVNKVKQLIEKGHPVNEKDLAGWSVIHEACNHGHVEIVNILLDNGAQIDDPGGENCDGITPLHDAAGNGHLDVIKLLLQRGACKSVVTNRGHTPLECLKRWRKTAILDAREEAEYEEVCNALKSNLDSTDIKEKRRRLVAVARANKTSKSIENEVCEIPIAERYKDRTSATALYRSAIEGVRRRRDEKAAPKVINQPKPALISEEEVVEDWLEEDMEIKEQSSKRRKIRRKDSPTSSRYERNYNKPKDHNVEMIFEEMNISDDSEVGSGKSRSVSPVFNVRRRSSNLVSEEPTKAGEETDKLSAVADPPASEAVKSRTENEKSPEQEKSEKCESLYKFKVSVNDELLLIPASGSEIKKLTVQWLIDSVVERYTEIHGITPDILLMTGDNAVPCGNDPLTIFVNEEIKTRVMGLKSVNLGDMYSRLVEKAPQQELIFSVFSKGSRPYEEVARALNIFATRGDLLLRDKHLELHHFLPVLKILQKVKRDIKILDLSRNYLGDEVIDPLMDYLERQSIERLYLKLNGITVRGIQHFARRIESIPEETLNSIKSIDFSFNKLKDESVTYLNIILNRLKNLEYFGTEYCKLSKPLKELSKTASSAASSPPVCGGSFTSISLISD